MRLMGIDYGTKRVGIALTDDRGMMAFPHAVIENNRDLLGAIEKIASAQSVTKIIVGHSLGREGKPNPVHGEVETLIGDLTLRLGLPIELEPEFYTTKEATRFQGKTDMTDASAASIILNSYITRMQHTNES